MTQVPRTRDRGYRAASARFSSSAVAAHRRRSRSRSWATGRTSAGFVFTTNAPPRKWAHFSSTAIAASSGPECCGVDTPGTRPRARPIAWNVPGAPRPRAVPGIQPGSNTDTLIPAPAWRCNSWAEAPPLSDPSRHKVVDHPAVGRITLDCDTLVVALDDLRITVYTAEPGTEDAERLALAVVLGTQALVD